MFDLFIELQEIIYINKITLEDRDMRGVVYQWEAKDENPSTATMVNIGHFFGVDISFFLEHTGQLKDRIDLSKMHNKKPLSREERRPLLKGIHRRLLGHINDSLKKNHLTIEDLASRIGVHPKLLRGIIRNRGIPRFLTLVKILEKLDINIILFFKQVKNKTKRVPLKQISKKTKSIVLKQDKKRTKSIFDLLFNDIWEIFKEIDDKSLGHDALRFKHAIYFQNTRANSDDIQKRYLSNLIKVAHVFDIKPSEVVRYANHFKSFIQSKKTTDFKSNTLLSNEQKNEFLIKIQRTLAEIFHQQNIDLDRLANETRLNRDYIVSIVQTQKHMPSYYVLERILKVLGTDMISFLQYVESSGNFYSRFAALKTQESISKSHHDQRKLKIVRFMGTRIGTVMEKIEAITDQNTITRLITRKDHTRSNTDISERDFSFKVLYKTSRVSNITLADLVSERPINELLNIQSIVLETVPPEDTRKAENVLSLLLFEEMKKQSLSIHELSIKSRSFTRAIERFLLGRNIPNYLSLHRIIEEGLGLSLETFFKNFEEKFQRLNKVSMMDLPLPQEFYRPYMSKKVKADLDFLKKRFFKAIEFLKSSGVPLKKLRESTEIHIPPKKLQQWEGYGYIPTYVKFSHFLGITLNDFLGPKDFSQLTNLNKLNFERIPKENINSIQEIIRENIHKARKASGISENDVQTMMGAYDSQKLIHVLRGPSSLSFRHFFQLSEITVPKGDYFLLLEGTDSHIIRH